MLFSLQTRMDEMVWDTRYMHSISDLLLQYKIIHSLTYQGGGCLYKMLFKEFLGNLTPQRNVTE